MGKKILAVIRTSTIKQEIQSQKLDLIKFCCSKGFKEIDIIFVEGFGASARKRNEKYLQMLNDIKTVIEKYNIKYVAVWHLNRLGRTEENLSSLKEYFEENKIQVYIKNPSLTLFNEDGTLNNGTSMAWTIFAMMIKFETVELMEKLNRGRKYRQEQKKYIGGVVLFGYSVNEFGYFQIDEEESKIVHYIFDKYESGEFSASKLAKDLIEKGYFTRQNKPFYPEVISTMLRTEDYYKDSIYPALITKEQFDKCRLIASKNAIDISKDRNIYLGSKLLKCLDCGCSFTPTKTNFGLSYLCNGSRQHKCNSEVRSIKALVVDYCLRREALNTYSSILVMNREKEISSFDEQLLDIKNRLSNLDDLIEDIQKKLSRLNKLYIDGKYLDDSSYNSDYEKLKSDLMNYEDRKQQLLRQQKSVRKQISVLKSSVVDDDVLSSFYSVRNDVQSLSDKDKVQLKKIINEVVSFVVFKKVVVEGKSYIAIIVRLLNGNYSLYFWTKKKLYFIPYSNKKNSLNFVLLSYDDVSSVSPVVIDENTKYVDLSISREQYIDIVSVPDSFVFKML